MRRCTTWLLAAAAVVITGCGSDAPTEACPYEVGLQQPVAGASCRYPLPPPPACNVDYDLAHIGIKVAGNEIVRDPNHADGWDYPDGTMNMVEIYGPRCDAITADPTLPVSVVFKLLLL